MVVRKYYEKKCPVCGTPYSRSSVKNQKTLGKPIMECSICKNLFIDQTCIEAAAFTREETFPQKRDADDTAAAACLALFIPAAYSVNVYLKWSNMWFVLIVAFGFLVSLVLRLIIMQITYRKNVQEWKEEYQQSCMRLQDPSYQAALKQVYAGKKGLLLETGEFCPKCGEVHIDTEDSCLACGFEFSCYHPQKEDMRVLHGETYKAAFLRMTNRKGPQLRKCVLILWILAFSFTGVFCNLSAHAQTEEVVHSNEVRIRKLRKNMKVNDYVEAEFEILGDIAGEHNFYNASKEYGKYDTYYSLAVGNGEQLLIVALNKEQHDRYAAGGKAFRAYGEIQDCPEEVMQYLSLDFLIAEQKDSSIAGWEREVADYCVKILNQSPNEEKIIETKAIMTDVNRVVFILVLIFGGGAILFLYIYNNRYKYLIKMIKAETAYRDI